MSRWLRLVVLAIAALCLVGSIDASPTYAYDVPAASHAAVREFGAVGTTTALRSGADGCVSRPVAARGASTTSSRSFIATNTADDVLRLGTKDSWGNLNTLDDHFARHGADFGATSVDDYARQASEFLQQPGTLTKIDADGVIRVYDPATNAFGAYNPNGTTRTFFTPKRGIDYWNDQPGVAP